MAITPLLAKRYSSNGRYYAWLIIVIGLIIPFRPQFENPVVKVIPTNTTTPIIQVGNGTQLIGPVENALPPSVTSHISLSWWQIAAAVWLVGMIAFLAYHAVKHYRFMKMARRWSETITDEQTMSLFQSLKAELGISKQIDLYQCLSVGTPMLIGFSKPKILLPNTNFAKDELRFIFNHELVHYKRKDLLYRCLVLSAKAIHWFNPLVHLMARAIDALCEMSCDAEVVRSTDADTRQHYSEAILGVVKYQSKMKTALSTNFYGGKNGMKKRIFSIMDTQNKKVGLVILCSVLILTLGTGFAFAANAETNSRPEYIKEDIVISPNFSYAYGFFPDPEIYANYSSYGITISDDGEKLLYNGQRVRLFVDEHSDVEAFYYDETGTVNLSVTRNSSREITAIDAISEEVAQEYRSAFFADNANGDIQTSETKYEQYAPYGITFLAEENSMYFNGQKVRLFVDESADGSFDALWVDEAGTVDLSVVRNSSGQITHIETISKEKAQDYIAAADKYEQDVLNGLDEKVAERIKELYPDN